MRVLDAFRPRGATSSGQVISSPPGPSGGPSKLHLLPGGGVPRVHRARSPVLPRCPRFATPRSVHQFAAVAAGAYPLRRPPNAWFICRLWVTDKKGNKHLATCLCDNGSEVNLQSENLLPDECVDTSLHPVNLEGVSGHALPGGNTGSFLKAHMVAQDLWEEDRVEDVV